MTQTQVQLALDAAEASLLAEVVDARLDEMRLELARTDDRRYRAGVHDRLERLEVLRGRLAELVPEASH